jgi:hypothetical protein
MADEPTVPRDAPERLLQRTRRGGQRADSSRLRTDADVATDDRDLASARRRHAWMESAERRRLMRTTPLVLISAIIFLSAAEVLSFFLTDSVVDEQRPIERLFLGSLIFVAVAYFVLAGLGLYRNFLRRQLQDRLRLGIVTTLQKEEKELAASGTDFDALWVLTQKRIDFYHEIATQQARSSFRSGQFAAYAGFAIVVLIAIFAAFTNSGTGAIAASVIGVAGAGLSAYVGATFMRAQESSAAQLRAYFLQPVEFARVLAAERLLGTLEADHRARIVEQIISSIVGTGGGRFSTSAPD